MAACSGGVDCIQQRLSTAAGGANHSVSCARLWWQRGLFVGEWRLRSQWTSRIHCPRPRSNLDREGPEWKRFSLSSSSSCSTASSMGAAGSGWARMPSFGRMRQLQPVRTRVAGDGASGMQSAPSAHAERGAGCGMDVGDGDGCSGTLRPIFPGPIGETSWTTAGSWRALSRVPVEHGVDGCHRLGSGGLDGRSIVDVMWVQHNLELGRKEA